MTTRAFVTGWPVKHSKSPALHGFWLEEHGIDGTYEAVAVDEPGFPGFLREFGERGFAGGNVTIPHKEAAFRLVEMADGAATAIGAVNTVWLENGRLCGGNTDAYGFTANLDECAPGWRSAATTTVLGAGGAARAIVYALCTAGLEKVQIVNRTVARAETLASQFGEKCTAAGLGEAGQLLPGTDLLVNTTAMGMSGGDTADLPRLEQLPSHAIVADIVYTPLETTLLNAAKNQGLQTVDGLGMLLHQAVPGFERWFGIRPQVTPALRNHIVGLL